MGQGRSRASGYSHNGKEDGCAVGDRCDFRVRNLGVAVQAATGRRDEQRHSRQEEQGCRNLVDDHVEALLLVPHPANQEAAPCQAHDAHHHHHHHQVFM